MSLRPPPSINVPITPNKFTNVWKLPSNKQLVLDYCSCSISDAFQKTGWSKLTTGGVLYLDTRLQMHSRVEKIHVFSSGYISIIGRNTPDDCPGLPLTYCGSHSVELAVAQILYYGNFVLQNSTLRCSLLFGYVV